MKKEKLKINNENTIKLVSSLLLFFIVFLVNAQPNQNTKKVSQDTTSLRVGISGSEPFLVKDQQSFEGISFEIWEKIANAEDINFTTRAYNQVSDALLALQHNEVDLVVGPTSITSGRAINFQFSQPYFESSLSILARKESPNLWERISPFFSTELLYAVLLFLFILGIVGTFLWLAERKASPEQFPPKPGRGIANGMWCAIVTMSTTGYGDLAPITFFGRFIAAIWMVISLLFAGTMIAGIASTLTLTGMATEVISTAAELENKKVAVLDGAPAELFAQQHGAQIIPVESIEDAYKLLKNKQVDAMVFDRPILKYFLNMHPDGDVVISSAQYLKQGYGFAFPPNSEIIDKINVKLLELEENGELDEIVHDWIGKK